MGKVRSGKMLHEMFTLHYPNEDRARAALVASALSRARITVGIEYDFAETLGAFFNGAFSRGFRIRINRNQKDHAMVLLTREGLLPLSATQS